MRWPAVLLLAFVLAFGSPHGAAKAEGVPPKGVAGLVFGSGLVTGSVFMVGPAAVICGMSATPGTCAVPFAVVGVGAFTAGVTGLVLGAKRRRAYNRWRRPIGLGLAPLVRRDGGGLLLTGQL